MNGIFIIETAAAKAFQVLHPSQRIRATNDASISDKISLPKQSTSVLNNMLKGPD